MIVLALDIASRVGWAVGTADKLTRSDSEILATRREGDDDATLHLRRLVRMQGWLEDTIDVFGVRHVVSEAPVPPRNVDMVTTWNTTLLLIGLYTIAKVVAVRMGCAHHSVPAPTWRVHFNGSGRADKKDGRRRCSDLNFITASEDESDAIGILSYELHRLRQTPTWDDRDDRGKPVVPFRRPGDVPLPPPTARAVRRAGGR